MTGSTREPTGGTGLGHREVEMSRTGLGRYRVRNVRGGVLQIGGGDSEDFTPVELLLTAIAGCTAVDVDHITSRRAGPESFVVEASGVKARSEERGNHMEEIEVTFRVRFPEGEDGDRAREMLPRAISRSHDRICTVTRTVELGTPVTVRQVDHVVGGEGADAPG
jgi:putative redox protein